MRSLLTAFLWLCAMAQAWAQVPADAVRRFVQNELGQIDGASRIEISVEPLDARLQLAPCARTEPFLHTGARLWGRTFVGLRCVSGAQWSVNVPVVVRVYGDALVAARLLPTGEAIGEGDVRTEEVEWTRELQGVARDVSQVRRHVPTRPIEAGKPIGLGQLTEMPVVAQGDPVKLIGRGRGFSVATDGVALAGAVAGQAVRVRVESGKILTGTAREGRIVEVAF